MGAGVCKVVWQLRAKKATVALCCQGPVEASKGPGWLLECGAATPEASTECSVAQERRLDVRRLLLHTSKTCFRLGQVSLHEANALVSYLARGLSLGHASALNHPPRSIPPR